MLWKEERKCKRCWAGGKAARGCGQGRRSGWAVLEAILPGGALHPAAGLLCWLPGRDVCSQGPRPRPGRERCRPRPGTGQVCVGESKHSGTAVHLEPRGGARSCRASDVSGPRVGFKKQLEVREGPQTVTPASLLAGGVFHGINKEDHRHGVPGGPEEQPPRAWPRCSPLSHAAPLSSLHASPGQHRSRVLP